LYVLLIEESLMKLIKEAVEVSIEVINLEELTHA
jgi:hypothetical protein